MICSPPVTQGPNKLGSLINLDYPVLSVFVLEGFTYQLLIACCDHGRKEWCGWIHGILFWPSANNLYTSISVNNKTLTNIMNQSQREKQKRYVVIYTLLIQKAEYCKILFMRATNLNLQIKLLWNCSDSSELMFIEKCLFMMIHTEYKDFASILLWKGWLYFWNLEKQMHWVNLIG